MLRNWIYVFLHSSCPFHRPHRQRLGWPSVQDLGSCNCSATSTSTIRKWTQSYPTPLHPHCHTPSTHECALRAVYVAPQPSASRNCQCTARPGPLGDRGNQRPQDPRGDPNRGSWWKKKKNQKNLFTPIPQNLAQKIFPLRRPVIVFLSIRRDSTFSASQNVEATRFIEICMAIQSCFRENARLK